MTTLPAVFECPVDSTRDARSKLRLSIALLPSPAGPRNLPFRIGAAFVDLSTTSVYHHPHLLSSFMEQHAPNGSSRDSPSPYAHYYCSRWTSRPLAKKSGRLTKVRELLEVQGVSANSANERGVRPMHMACQCGDMALVQRLLELGEIAPGVGLSAGRGGVPSRLRPVMTRGVTMAWRGAPLVGGSSYGLWYTRETHAPETLHYKCL